MKVGRTVGGIVQTGPCVYQLVSHQVYKSRLGMWKGLLFLFFCCDKLMFNQLIM